MSVFLWSLILFSPALLISQNGLLSEQLDSVRSHYEQEISVAGAYNLQAMYLHYAYGRFLNNEGLSEQAAAEFEKAFTIACSKNQDSIIVETGNYLGEYHLNNSNFEQSLNYYNKALEFSKQNQLAQITANNMIGVVYRRLDKPHTATRYHIEALRSIENYPGDYADISFQHRVALNSIGNIYFTLEQHNEAISFYRRSLKLEMEENNHLGMAINYANIGECLFEETLLDSALVYFSKSLEENKKINSGLGQALCYNHIGEVYSKRGELQKAIVQFDSAAIYSSQLNDNWHRAFSNRNLANAYISLGDFTNAKMQLHILDSLSRLTGNPMFIQSHAELKSNYFEKQNKVDSALHYFKIASVYNDSIVKENNVSAINDILTLYESQKKEKQIELLSAENKLKNQGFILSIVILIALLMLFAFGVLLFYRNRKENQRKQENLRQQVLRSQMNPHFIFNVLGSIQSFMLSNDTSKAASYLTSFASLTRFTLEYTAEEKVLLSKEIEMLKNYIELESMRIPGVFEYRIEAEEGLEADFIEISPMMIQPFVENSIKHGFKEMRKGGELFIKIEEQEGYIKFSIQDNGTGLNGEQTNKISHRSMAMDIFEKRKKLIQKKCKKPIEFEKIDIKDIDSGKSGVRVSIKLPIYD